MYVQILDGWGNFSRVAVANTVRIAELALLAFPASPAHTAEVRSLRKLCNLASGNCQYSVDGMHLLSAFVVHRMPGMLLWQLRSSSSAMQQSSVSMFRSISILNAAASLVCRSSWIDICPTSVGFPSWLPSWLS